MARYFGMLAMLVLLGACVRYPDLNQERLETLPQHYVQFDVDLAWQVKQSGSGTLIDGEFKNLRYDGMDNIEVWVAVLDAAGRPMARSVSYPVPHLVRRDEVVPFSLKLPVVAPPGTGLRFTYKYLAVEDGGGKNGNWMQSFQAEVPAP